MKKILLNAGIAFAIFATSCSGNKTSKSVSYNNKDATAMQEKAVAKTDTAAEEECKGITDPRLETGYNQLNQGNGYSYQRPETNFQGAAGYGTGSSYASSALSSKRKKSESNKSCPIQETGIVNNNYENNRVAEIQNSTDSSAYGNTQVSNRQWGSDETWQGAESNSWETQAKNSNKSSTPSDTMISNSSSQSYDEVPW